MSQTQFQPAFVQPNPLDPTSHRLEIDEFVDDNDRANLFLLALEEMQKEEVHRADDQNEDWFSYYNLSSIHGYPEERWRGVKNLPPMTNVTGYYCCHGSTVFPTWHRCQMFTFEQAIFRKMTEIASQFTADSDKIRYQKALKGYRLPYWDPLMPRYPIDEKQTDPQQKFLSMFGVPSILLAKQVWVRRPGASQLDQIDNPLYSFKFPDWKNGKVFKQDPKDPDSGKRVLIPWTGLGYGAAWAVRTIRAPDSDGTQNDQTLESNVRDQIVLLATTMLRLLTPESKENQERSWDVFANHWVDKTGTTSRQRWDNGVSLESWHDNIHGLIGSGDGVSGHMGTPSLASFDPIFWLHHNNIERLFALYQALFGHQPGRYVAEDIKPPYNVGAKSDLSPYERSSGNFYNSLDIKDFAPDGYAVPGKEPVDDKARKQVADYLHETYNWIQYYNIKGKPKNFTYPIKLEHSIALKGTKAQPKPEDAPARIIAREMQKLMVLSTADAGTSTAPIMTIEPSFKDEIPESIVFSEDTLLDDPTQMFSWAAHYNVRKYAFGASFTLQLFIGKHTVPENIDATSFFTAPNEAGFSTVFAASAEGACQNCRANADLIYGDIVPLTAALAKCLRSNPASPDVWPPAELRVLDNLSAEQVEPFLKQHLEWRLVDMASVLKSPEDVTASELEIIVCDRVYQRPTPENPIGVYSNPTPHPDITRGKVGGWRD